MLISYKNKIYTLSLLLCFVFTTARASVFSEPLKKSNSNTILKQYFKIHKEFSKNLCSPGTEEYFWKLFRKFRGDGNFIPVLPSDKLDKTTIVESLHLLKEKSIWIKKQIDFLNKNKNFNKQKIIISKLQKQLDELLSYKRHYFEAKTSKQKSLIKNESKYKFIEFKSEFSKLIKGIPFLLSFNFPLDHFSLRLEYDTYKSRDDIEGKRKANKIYFYRKVVQDGAQDPDHKRSDRFLRATIDTVFLKMNKPSFFIEEELRYDFASVLEGIKRQLSLKNSHQKKRLNEWSDRTKRGLKFYKKISSSKKIDNIDIRYGSKLVAEKARARYILKKYVQEKEALTYKFWSQQPELMRALFSIETILFNEVGGLDGRDALERKDVTQVVINRFNNDKYNTISKKESLYPYLENLKISKLDSYKWLNVMLKEGEFSFSYFFIPGNVKIYCPDMTRRGRFLRRENLRVGLSLLKKPSESFKALRYFSRASMLGRIDMAKLWNDYTPLKERPGLKARHTRILERLYAQGKYKFFYDFKTEDNQHFKVIEIKRKVYVLPVESIKFYKYRNPHFFKYFTPLN